MVGIGSSIRSRSVGAVDPVIGLVQWLSKSKPVEDSFNPPPAFFLRPASQVDSIETFAQLSGY